MLDQNQRNAEGLSSDASVLPPHSCYLKQKGISTTHTEDSGTVEDTCTIVQGTTYFYGRDPFEIYQNKIKAHWTDLKREINVKTSSRMFQQIGWIQFADVGNNKRSIEVEKLLNEVTPQVVSRSHFEQFKKVVGHKIFDIPSKTAGHRLHLFEPEDKCRLQNIQELLVETLLPQHVLEIKDNFLQCDIIDFEENKELCLNPGLYQPRNKSIVHKFVDLAIKKVHLGSYQCMVSCIETLVRENHNKKLDDLLLTLESSDGYKKDSSDNENVDSIKESKKTVKVTFTKATLQKEVEDNEEDINAYITIKFDKDNTETRHLYEMIKKRTISDLRKYTAVSLGLECTKVELGSVIIHLKSLDGKLRSRLRNNILNTEMKKLIELIFTDAEVNSLITPGAFCLEMEVRTAKTLQVEENISTHHWDVVADNKSFLVEEIDTEVIANAFERHGKYFSKERLQGDRCIAAKHIAEEIIQNNWQETFRDVLEENHLTYIQKRFRTYERVSRADTTYLRQNIVTHFPVLIANIELNEMRGIFTEREIFKKHMFDNIEQKYVGDREKANVNFLIEVLRSGSDAMLTLIDALFVVQLDDFAKDLMNSRPKDVCIKKEADCEDFIVQWSDTSVQDVIIKVNMELVVLPTVVVDQSFRYDVMVWKKIRNETITRLERLETELRLKNEKIKTDLMFSYLTLGLSFFGDIFFSPFTRGSSLAATPTVLSTVTTGVYLLEMYVEQNMLETTQESIYKDKAETLRQRASVTSYTDGHKRTEDFNRDLRSTVLDAIIRLSQQPLKPFLASFIDTTNMSLLKAIDQVIFYRKQLESELKQVEETEGRFCWNE